MTVTQTVSALLKAITTAGRDRERFSINLTYDLTLTSRYDLILPFFGSTPCILTTSKRPSNQ
jgi:hypothetical protein